MAKYDVLPSKVKADSFLATYINGHFPKVDGNYEAKIWAPESRETTDKRGAIPAIPEKNLIWWFITIPCRDSGITDEKELEVFKAEKVKELEALREGYKAALTAAGGEYHVELSEQDDFPQPKTTDI